MATNFFVYKNMWLITIFVVVYFGTAEFDNLALNNVTLLCEPARKGDNRQEVQVLAKKFGQQFLGNAKPFS